MSIDFQALRSAADRGDLRGFCDELIKILERTDPRKLRGFPSENNGGFTQ